MWVCVLLAAALAGLAPCDARPKGGKNDEALGSAEAPENPSCQDVVGAASHKCPRTNLQAQTQEYIDAACESAQKLVATKDAVVERLGNDACYTALDLPTNATHTEQDNCENFATGDSHANYVLPGNGSAMCTYAAGNTERGWEADCYTSAAYIAAAAAKFETENCSVQADLDTIIKSCASASESAFNDTAKAELAAMVSGWGNATNKIACALPMDPTPAVCPKDCQTELDHYLELCSESYVKWEELKDENNRLIAAIGCNGAARQVPAVAMLMAAVALLVGDRW